MVKVQSFHAMKLWPYVLYLSICFTGLAFAGGPKSSGGSNSGGADDGIKFFAELKSELKSALKPIESFPCLISELTQMSMSTTDLERIGRDKVNRGAYGLWRHLNNLVSSIRERTSCSQDETDKAVRALEVSKPDFVLKGLGVNFGYVALDSKQRFRDLMDVVVDLKFGTVSSIAKSSGYQQDQVLANSHIVYGRCAPMQGGVVCFASENISDNSDFLPCSEDFKNRLRASPPKLEIFEDGRLEVKYLTCDYSKTTPEILEQMILYRPRENP